MTADAPRNPKGERRPDLAAQTIVRTGACHRRRLPILGGVFNFLPVFGVWVLPLGLMIIAQGVPALQKPLVFTFG